MVADVAAIQPADSLQAKVTFYALQGMPMTGLQPLSPRVRLIVATREGMPVLPSARLTLGVKLRQFDRADTIFKSLAAGKYGPNAVISAQSGILLRGATAAFTLEERQGEPDVIPGQNAVRQIALQLHRSSTAPRATTQDGPRVEIGLAVNDFVTPQTPREAGELAPPPPRVGAMRGFRNAPAASQPAAPPPTPVYQSEVALFSLPPETQALGLFIPIQFGGSASRAILAIVEISPGGADSAYRAAVAKTIDELKQSSQSAAAAVTVLPGGDPADWPGLSSTIGSLAWSGRQRAALCFLATQSGADITLDVALAAGETTLSELSQRTVRAISSSPNSRTHKSIGWLLERTTLRMLLQMQTSGKMSPELAGILALRAGEAGRHPETLEEVLTHAADQQDLQNRLAAENYTFLEDSSPASRVRAFDWLNARGLSPSGFDPLASMRERRAALEQAETAAATQPSQP
jgi:hypothetical protein